MRYRDTIRFRDRSGLGAGDRLRAILAAGSDLYHWFDVALTNGAQVIVSGGSAPTRLMDMSYEYTPRLDLVSAGNQPPVLTIGGNDATALYADNDGTEYMGMGAEDNVSLRIPDASEWSIVTTCRPVETGINYLTGSELGASSTVADYLLNIRYFAGSGRTQYPQLIGGGTSFTRIADTGREYANRDHVLAIGFDTVNGLTLAENGFVRTVNATDKNSLTDTKFQFFGTGNLITSLNFNGLFYGALIYRKNIFKAQYADYHVAAVKSYGDRLGLAHAFV